MDNLKKGVLVYFKHLVWFSKSISVDRGFILKQQPNGRYTIETSEGLCYLYGENLSLHKQEFNH